MKPITLVVSAARSGTRLLSKQLATVPDMTADHECEAPSFCSLRQENIVDPSIGKKFVEGYFSDYIESLPGKYYSNTAQSTSKGFIEHFLDLDKKPNFIFIRRDPRLIAKSLWELEWIPGTHPMHRVWYPGPQEPGVLPYADWRKSHRYQLCYWYVADHERRAQHYEKLFAEKGISTWHMDIPKMLDLKEFNDMLEHFHLPNVSELSQKKVNGLQTWKDYAGFGVLPDELCYRLELDVLDRIPADFKANLLSRGWAQP
jgi:hypothetical protein